MMRTVELTDLGQFVKHQMTASAGRALVHGPDKYAGLGDCFCITDCRYGHEPSRGSHPSGSGSV